jgi:hypothetical protein
MGRVFQAGWHGLKVQTMLTVLTQKQPFASANRDEGYRTGRHWSI